MAFFKKLFLDKNCFLCHKTYYYKTTGFSNPGSLGIAFKGWKASCHSWKRSSLFAWSIWFDQEIHWQDKSTFFGYANGKRLCSGFRSKLCWTSKVSNRIPAFKIQFKIRMKYKKIMKVYFCMIGVQKCPMFWLGRGRLQNSE